MSQVYQFDPEAKVIGQVLFIFPENQQAEKMRPLLERFGFATLDPEAWYRVQDVVGLFEAITTGSEAMFNLVSIGMEIAQKAVLPADLAALSAEEFFPIIGQVYQLQHQGDVGYVTTNGVEPTHFAIEIVSPYPDDFWYGCIYGWARRYLPEGTAFVVEYDPDIPRRDNGGDTTVIHVSW
ncbi:MAG: hypothetical protein GYB65_16865 [Chloroflexi bacterium]|nr:hypothetical protein [Chloroflexota bacterium]